MFCLFVISSTVRNVDACRPAPHHRCLAGEYRISIENDPLRPLPALTARPPLSSPPPSHCKAFLLPLPERSVLVYILLARRSPDRMTPPPPQLCAFVIVTSLTHCKGDRWRRSRSGVDNVCANTSYYVHPSLLPHLHGRGRRSRGSGLETDRSAISGSCGAAK